VVSVDRRSSNERSALSLVGSLGLIRGDGLIDGDGLIESIGGVDRGSGRDRHNGEDRGVSKVVSVLEEGDALGVERRSKDNVNNASGN